MRSIDIREVFKKKDMEIFNGIYHLSSPPPFMALISIHFYPTFFLLQVKFTYSVVSVVVPRLEEAILAPVVKKIFKRPSILGQEGHRYPPKHSKLSYDHFGGWLETSNHPFLPRVLSNVGKSRLHRVWVLLQVNMSRADRWQKVGLQNNSTML